MHRIEQSLPVIAHGLGQTSDDVRTDLELLESTTLRARHKNELVAFLLQLKFSGIFFAHISTENV